MNQSSNLKLQALAIGSLPHDNVEEAMLLVKKNFSEIPFFPQLANINKSEDMTFQFLEGLPSFLFSKLDNFYIDSESDEFFEALEEFFLDYEEIISDINSEKLEKYGINVTIRREMGRDIDGACGQLRRRHKEQSLQ